MKLVQIDKDLCVDPESVSAILPGPQGSVMVLSSGVRIDACASPKELLSLLSDEPEKKVKAKK